MSTEIVSAESVALKQNVTNKKAFEAILQKQMGSISQVAASHISASRLIAIAVGAAMRNPTLFKCEAVTVVRSLLQAAEIGLEVGALNEAYLVPFKNNKRGGIYECQLMIDYRGYLKLCWQSNLIASMDASVVYTTDKFVFRKGTEVEIDYEPNIDADLPDRFWPDENDATIPNRWSLVRCVYAAAKLTTGGKVAIVLTRSQVERYRSRSAAKSSNFWVNDWEPMAVKTALKRLQNMLPKSSQIAKAIALDDQAEFGNDAPIVFDIPEANEVAEEETQNSGMEAAKASLKAKNARDTTPIEDDTSTRPGPDEEATLTI